MNRAQRIKKYQWMRNAEAGQKFGNRMEIRPLTEEAFERFVLPRLQNGFANTFTEFQIRLPQITHYAVIWRDGGNDWQFIGVGSLEELESEPRNSIWAIEVKDLESPQVINYGKTADSGARHV